MTDTHDFQAAFEYFTDLVSGLEDVLPADNVNIIANRAALAALELSIKAERPSCSCWKNYVPCPDCFIDQPARTLDELTGAPTEPRKGE